MTAYLHAHPGVLYAVVGVLFLIAAGLVVMIARYYLSNQGTHRAPGHRSDPFSDLDDFEWRDEDPDVAALRRSAHPEVVLGLTANSLLRGIAGFLERCRDGTAFVYPEIAAQAAAIREQAKGKPLTFGGRGRRS